MSFIQFSNRLSNVKIKVSGGVISLISAYAPPNYVHNLEERIDFFTQLYKFSQRCSTHGPLYILGYFDARAFYQQPGEENIVGPFPFECPSAQIANNSNRDLLVEACQSAELLISNTFVGRL